MNDEPEQDAQSVWQERHEEPEVNVPVGHEEMHLPLDARSPDGQERQKVEEEAQDAQDESQGAQVVLSSERKVPVGQASTHLPSERKEPGKHPVHSMPRMVLVSPKFGIRQAVHFAPQVSQSFFSLSATSCVPWHTPFPSAVKQTPSNKKAPLGHAVQSFDVEPLHELQLRSQARQFPASLKVPEGQRVPSVAEV